MGFTVPDAHLLAIDAHDGQVDEHGDDHYLAHLRPLGAALRRYGPEAEMAGLLSDILAATRDHPDPDRRYDLDRLRGLGVPEVVVEAVDAVTQRPGEAYMSGFVRRAATHPLGRLVMLVGNSRDLAAGAALAATDPDKARTLREGRYRPARRILLAAEAADRRYGCRVLV